MFSDVAIIDMYSVHDGTLVSCDVPGEDAVFVMSARRIGTEDVDPRYGWFIVDSDLDVIDLKLTMFNVVVKGTLTIEDLDDEERQQLLDAAAKWLENGG